MHDGTTRCICQPVLYKKLARTGGQYR